MMSRLGYQLSIAVLLAGESLSTGTAWADSAASTEDSGALEEIVVTAQKRAENLQQVPIAVTAISNSQLQAAGVISTGDLANAVAGLDVNTTALYFSPHIRGIGTTSFGPGVENPVALYVDNVYYASQLMAPTDLSDVSQVTVLKGPQGTLFGRNATGGVLQMTTREPAREFGSEFRTELDNYLTSRNFAYVTGGLGNDLNANLAATFTTQGHGWGTNLETGAETHRIDHDLAVRNKWVWTPSDGTAIRLSFDFTDQKNSLGPNLIIAPGSNPLLPGIGKTLFPGNIYDVASPINDLNTYRGGGASLVAEQDLGFARLVNILAYRRYNFDTHFDVAASVLLASDTAFNQRGKQITEELQLVSPTGSWFTWTLGAFYYWNREALDGPIVTLYGPAAFAGNKDALVYGYTLGVESIAGYAQATAALRPDTRLTAGVRYSNEKRSELRAGVTTVIDDTISIPDVVPPSSFSTSSPTWRLALDHDLMQDLMGYVSYNRGFKSGGYNAISRIPDAPPYKPEKLDAYEMGLKTELFDRSLRLNPAVFYYNYSDIQVTKFTGSSTTILNGARARLYGLDLDAQWRASSALSFLGGLEWLHTKFTEFTNAPGAVPTPVIGGSTAIVIPNAAGNQIPYAARYTANLGVTYLVHVGESSLDLNLTDSYNSGFYTEPDNRLHQSSYDYLNSAVTWHSRDGMLSVGLWARNLLNKAVTSELSAVPPTGDFADYGNPPRTYGFTFEYHMGAQ